MNRENAIRSRSTLSNVFGRAGSTRVTSSLAKQAGKANLLQHRIKQHGEFGRRLLWLDKASDADLHHCYTHARALVYPSMIEGFGLPLVEAGRYGLPVIASDLPVFHEIGGDHVRYFNLLDSIDLADKIEELYREPIKKEKMPIYSWDDSARSLANLILHDAYQTRTEVVPA